MASKSWITSYPGKFIWTFTSIALNALKLPLWSISLLPSSCRQNPKWTYKQALMVKILSAILQHVADVEMKGPLGLEPGKEKDRFVVIHPSKREKYVGCVAKDPEIVPIDVGGTWYPTRPDHDLANANVILHFHGGAYVIGNGRTSDAGFAAKTILKNTPAKYVFCPQYRLASNPGGRFPAYLQDAITSYLYLIETLSVPAENITISGDSAGGNICLSLLRYVADNEGINIPNPNCAWLWSPWIDPAGSLVRGNLNKSPHVSTDYLGEGFGAWGAKAISPSKTSGLTLAHPNICFKNSAFQTPTPLYFSVGECEVLYHDDIECYESFKIISGNKVQLQIENRAVHDIILIGNIIGFEEEAILGAKRAGEFLKSLGVQGQRAKI